MNKKAEKFEKMLKENKIECFQKEEIKDELHTVLYRSFMEIEGLQLPVVVILDDSIYSIFRRIGRICTSYKSYGTGYMRCCH